MGYLSLLSPSQTRKARPTCFKLFSQYIPCEGRRGLVSAGKKTAANSSRTLITIRSSNSVKPRTLISGKFVFIVATQPFAFSFVRAVRGARDGPASAPATRAAKSTAAARAASAWRAGFRASPEGTVARTLLRPNSRSPLAGWRALWPARLLGLLVELAPLKSGHELLPAGNSTACCQVKVYSKLVRHLVDLWAIAMLRLRCGYSTRLMNLSGRFPEERRSGWSPFCWRQDRAARVDRLPARALPQLVPRYLQARFLPTVEAHQRILPHDHPRKEYCLFSDANSPANVAD